MATETHKLEALLLLGPTGSGKTPLGDWLETHGLGGRRCYHFDFGANLRAVVQRGPCHEFSHEEIQFLKNVLEQGVLLEDASFYLAEKILAQFIAARGLTHAGSPRDAVMLILNGLPRHVGQAQALEKMIHVSHLLQLECEAGVIRERLRQDSGGDRQGRRDDTDELVVRKLAIYAQRTQPLVLHYRRQGGRVISIPVAIQTQPEDLTQALQVMMLGSEQAGG